MELMLGGWTAVGVVILVWGMTFASTRALLADFSALEILLLRFSLAYSAPQDWVRCQAWRDLGHPLRPRQVASEFANLYAAKIPAQPGGDFGIIHSSREAESATQHDSLEISQVVRSRSCSILSIHTSILEYGIIQTCSDRFSVSREITTSSYGNANRIWTMCLFGTRLQCGVGRPS